MDIFGIRTWADVRAFLYVLTPVVLSAFVSYGLVNDSQAALWGGFLTAILSPLLALVNTVEGFRKWFYGVVAAGQALLVGLDIFTEAQVSPIVSIILAVVGSGVAAVNTPVSHEQ